MLELLRRLLSVRPPTSEEAPAPSDAPQEQAPPPQPITPEEAVPTFAVGCGRSGTHCVARLMEQDSRLDAYHLDSIGNMVADSFLAYCLWNELPVDTEGFLSARAALVDAASRGGRLYFEANPYLAFAVRLLRGRFGAKFVHMVRRPEDVVNSHSVKGWYDALPVCSDPRLALGFQYGLERPNYSFGRVVPRGSAFADWQRLTRIGKIAWMWNATNMAVIRQLEDVPRDHHMMVKLESFDYREYLRLHKFVGGASPIAEDDFAAITSARPGRGKSTRLVESWTEVDMREFRTQTQEARAILGYAPP